MKKNSNIIYKDYIFIFIISFLFLIFFSTSTSPLFKNYEDDSGIFITVGRAMNNGKIIYKDIFDHKGPIFFFIQAIGQKIHDGKMGIFLLQVLSLSITNYFLLKTCLILTNKSKSYISLLVGLLLLANFIEEGNLTEEFSLPFISICMYIAIKWYQNKVYSKNIYLYSLIFGLTFSSISLIRLNNAIPIAGMLIAIIFIFVKNKKIKELLKCGLFFILGFIIIYVPILLYFYIKSAVKEMIYATFIHNLLYLKYNKDLKNILLLFPSILLFICCIKNEKNNIIIIFNYIFTIVSFFIGRNFIHYYIILIPVSVILFAIFIDRNFKEKIIMMVYSYVLFAFFITPFFKITTYFLIQSNEEKNNLNYIFKNIPEEDKDSILVYNSLSGFIYAEGNIIPAYKYAFIQNNLFQTNNSIYIETYEYIKNNNIKWIISTDFSKINKRNEIENYILKNYKLIYSTQINYINNSKIDSIINLYKLITQE